MTFSRTLFYQLRDLAVLVNHGSIQLRYSDSSLELQYEYHTEYEESISFFSRWAPIGTLAVLVPQIWSSPFSWTNVMCLVFIVIAILQLFQKSSSRLEPAGSAVLTYSASDEYFRFEYPNGDGLPLSNTLLLRDIQTVRVRTATNGGEDDPVYGLVEIQRTLESTWILLAELPNKAAARQFVVFLSQLTDATEIIPDSPTTLRFRKFGRRLAHYYRLIHGKTR